MDYKSLALELLAAAREVSDYPNLALALIVAALRENLETGALDES